MVTLATGSVLTIPIFCTCPGEADNGHRHRLMAKVEAGPTGGIEIRAHPHGTWHEANLSARQVLIALTGTTGMTAVMEFVVQVFRNGNNA